MTLVFKHTAERAVEWARLMAVHAPELSFEVWPEIGDPAAVRYLATWEAIEDIDKRFPNLEILFSIGAGIDQFDLSALPQALKVVRMIEPGLVQGMVEYVSMAALALHRDVPEYVSRQRSSLWQPQKVVPAAERRIGIMGLGVLGKAVASTLANFGFPLSGWSKSRQSLPRVQCYAGTAELNAFLKQCDILICLLPLTPATKAILNSHVFEKLPRGASLVNCGRGGHLVENDLLEALDTGQMKAAVLDVSQPEPPVPGHPFWNHPRIWLTPHIASVTHATTAVQVMAENIRRNAQGLPLSGLIDRAKGY